MLNWRQHQKYKGRVVFRGDIVKDASGSYGVFTEQGSSASQMTAAKVMDIISRLPGCDGQAADAVSDETQVKKEDAPKLLKNPKSECPDIWIRLPRNKWPKSCPVWKTRSFFWSEICTVTFSQDYYGKGNSRKFYWNTVGKKFQIENVYSVTQKKGLFLSVYVDDIKLAGKIQHLDPMWKILMKDVDLGELT